MFLVRERARETANRVKIKWIRSSGITMNEFIRSFLVSIQKKGSWMKSFQNFGDFFSKS